MDREMKQIPAFFVAVLLLAAGTALASEVQVGLQGGLSVPNIRGGTGIYSEGFTSRKGVFFGVFANYQFSENFSLRAEIDYASQGGKKDGMQPVPLGMLTLPLPPGTILFADFFTEAILNYLEIPVLLELSWGKKPRFYINAGPYIGFLLNAKTITSGMSSFYYDKGGISPVLLPPDYQPIPPVSFDATTDITEEINDINAGIAGGAGVSFSLGPGDIIAAFHFSWGMTNIEKNSAVYGKDQTGALVFTIGYSVALNSGK